MKARSSICTLSAVWDAVRLLFRRARGRLSQKSSNGRRGPPEPFSSRLRKWAPDTGCPARLSGLSGVLLSYQRSLVPDGALYIMTAIMRFRPPGWPLRFFSGEWTLDCCKRKPENTFILPLSPQGLEPKNRAKQRLICLRLKGSSGLSRAPVGLRTTRVSFSN